MSPHFVDKTPLPPPLLTTPMHAGEYTPAPPLPNSASLAKMTKKVSSLTAFSNRKNNLKCSNIDLKRLETTLK